MKLLRTALALGLCAGLLSGCESIRRAAGLQKKSPDEFAVTTKAPLVIPPDFNLRPPTPGAPPSNAKDPSTTAELALFSNTDVQAIAKGLPGTYTMGERMLLANAKAQTSDPAIRARLNADQRAVQDADRSFTDRILNTSATRDTGAPINADAEVAKGSRAAAAAAAAKKKRAKSGGWFDWL
jgi:hypothetical protein